jgi:FixJ family two-component response regulator
MPRKPSVSPVAVVEDDDAVREATESLLRSAGFDVEEFATAEAFLRSGCLQRAACLVLDVRLPGMSGLELQRYLAAIDFRIPIVFVTAQPDGEGRLRSRALRAGALAFLTKPFGARELLAAVDASGVVGGLHQGSISSRRAAE